MSAATITPATAGADLLGELRDLLNRHDGAATLEDVRQLADELTTVLRRTRGRITRLTRQAVPEPEREPKAEAAAQPDAKLAVGPEPAKAAEQNSETPKPAAPEAVATRGPERRPPAPLRRSSLAAAAPPNAPTRMRDGLATVLAACAWVWDRLRAGLAAAVAWTRRRFAVIRVSRRDRAGIAAALPASREIEYRELLAEIADALAVPAGGDEAEISANIHLLAGRALVVAEHARQAVGRDVSPRVWAESLRRRVEITDDIAQR